MGNFASSKPDDAEILFQLFINQEVYDDMREMDYGIENIVFQGSGAKAIAYIGAMKALDDVGLLPRVKRFGGSGTGAILATRLAIGCSATDAFNDILNDMNGNVQEEYACLAVPNLIKNFGVFPGDKILEGFHHMLAKYTGNPNLTFKQLYVLRGVELCLCVTNVSTGHLEYWHPKTAPDYSIATACKIVMTTPLVMQPFRLERTGLGCEGREVTHDLFVDGALVNNFPLHVYDGYFLDMDPKRSFFHLMDRLSVDMPNFNVYNEKTIGLNAYDAFSAVPNNDKFIEQLRNLPRGVSRPDTKLARKNGPSAAASLKLKVSLSRKTAAAEEFLKFMADNNLNRDSISVNELGRELGKCPKETLEQLFGNKVARDPSELAFKMDANKDKEVSAKEFMHYAASKCNYIEQAIYKTGVPREIRSLPDFAQAAFYEIPATANWKRQMKRKDSRRIISIYTDYLTRGDTKMELQDKLFAIRQGWSAAVKYLRSRVRLPERNLEQDISIQECEEEDEEIVTGGSEKVMKVEEVKEEEKVKVSVETAAKPAVSSGAGI